MLQAPEFRARYLRSFVSLPPCKVLCQASILLRHYPSYDGAGVLWLHLRLSLLTEPVARKLYSSERPRFSAVKELHEIGIAHRDISPALKLNQSTKLQMACSLSGIRVFFQVPLNHRPRSERLCCARNRRVDAAQNARQAQGQKKEPSKTNGQWDPMDCPREHRLLEPRRIYC